MSVHAEVKLRSRVEAIRHVCLMLAGGNPAKPPADIEDKDHIGPPGPAAEFAHDQKAIGNGAKWQEGVGFNDEAPYAFHRQIRQAHNLGIETVKETPNRSESQRVSGWTLQAMAGAPVMAIMLDRLPKLMTGLVRHHTTMVHCT